MFFLFIFLPKPAKRLVGAAHHNARQALRLHLFLENPTNCLEALIMKASKTVRMITRTNTSVVATPTFSGVSRSYADQPSQYSPVVMFDYKAVQYTPPATIAATIQPVVYPKFRRNMSAKV
jgi:hypothetical protein